MLDRKSAKRNLFVIFLVFMPEILVLKLSRFKRLFPYLQKEWCIRVCEKPLRVEPQENNRYRFWGVIEELEGRILRVVTLSDKRTIHNAFPDRRFKL